MSNAIGKAKPRLLVADAGFKDFAVQYVPTYNDLLSRLAQLDAFGTHRPFHLGYEFTEAEADLPFWVAKELGNTALLLDEGEKYHPDFLPGYHEAIYRGRHYDLDLIINSLAPVDFPTDLRRQMTRIISFRQIMPNDVEWLSKIVGDLAYELPDLPGPQGRNGPPPPYPYLIWTSHQGAKILRPGDPEYGIFDRPLTKL